jgi:hypothetical protein
MTRMEVWPEPVRMTGEKLRASALIELPDGEKKELWYTLPGEYGGSITESHDHFLLGVLLTAMRKRCDVHIHGTVSPFLLENLEEFQAVWANWLPKRYSTIGMAADVEAERGWIPQERAIAAFSGGVDSAFTVWRHYKDRCGRLRKPIQAGLMVRGFDIPVQEEEIFDRAADKSRRMLQSVGMELIPMATNYRDFGDDWLDSHGIATTSCLMLLQGGFTTGLIASTEPYNSLVLPWGSNPLTDRLLSSRSFTSIHDGASFTRSTKVKGITDWPEALANLRVCWQGDLKDRNCGVCEKCIRTILNFRAVGAELPACFEQDVSDRQIAGLRNLNPVQVAYLEEILNTAGERGMQESWVTALKACIAANQPPRRRPILMRVKRKIRNTLGLFL